MSDFAICAGVASQLPALEPIAGACLTLNLAYLNLDRFRYRVKIRDEAKAALKALDKSLETDTNGAPLPKEVTESNYYKVVLRLAVLPDNDPMGERSDPSQSIKAPDLPVKMPNGVAASVYVHFFEDHWDRFASKLATGISLAILILGVAHSINHLTFLECVSGGWWSIFWFYVLTLGTALPIICVWFSRFVVKWGCETAQENVAQLTQIGKGFVAQAKMNAQNGNGPKPNAPTPGGSQNPNRPTMPKFRLPGGSNSP